MGELTWDTFDEPGVEKEFMKILPGQVADLIAQMSPAPGIVCEVEITEVAEL